MSETGRSSTLDVAETQPPRQRQRTPHRTDPAAPVNNAQQSGQSSFGANEHRSSSDHAKKGTTG
jgi:hypothetical protein